MTIRVQVSCWCWAQAREIRSSLPTLTPVVEDWYPEPEPEQDILDQIMAEHAEPMIYMFYDVNTQPEAILIDHAASSVPIVISGKEYRPVVVMQGDA